jgi:hypothetical protein
MSKVTPSRKLAPAIAAGALLAACATVDTGVGWNIPPVGSTWQVSQRNTGSYGKDVTFQITRGDGEWQGTQVVTLASSANGVTVLALPNGKWAAILGRDGKPLVTYDPPIGYVYPLSVGQTWSTQHKMTSASGSSTDITYGCKVEGRESVTVPAGTFDTLKIVCESPDSRNVSWTSIDHGVHAKQEFERYSNHPQGAGTQQAQLVALDRRP